MLIVFSFEMIHQLENGHVIYMLKARFEIMARNSYQFEDIDYNNSKKKKTSYK